MRSTAEPWRITVITALWKRHAITRAFWQWYAHLKTWWPDVEVSAAVSGTDDPVHQQMATDAGATYVDVPNLVGAKFNRALQAARPSNPDAVLVMGSDDIFTAEVAAAYRTLFMEPMPYVGLRDFFFLNTVTGEAGYWPGYYHRQRRGEPAGGGRLIPRWVLDACRWSLWDHFGHHGMDRHAFQKMAAVGCGAPHLIVARDTGGVALSLKGPDSMWGYQQIGHRPWPGDLLRGFPMDIRESVRALRHEARDA